MLLKSSSTPVLCSPLLSSFADSPSNTFHSETSHAIKHLPLASVYQNHHKLSLNQTGSLNLSSFSCNSSPVSPSIADLDRHNNGFRRVQSEGNLQDLAYVSCNNHKGRLRDTNQPKSFSARLKCLTLESFSFYDYKVESDTEDGEQRVELEEEKVNGFADQEEVGGKEMYLARGLPTYACGDGIGGCRGSGGGGGEYNSMGSGEDDGYRHGVEDYYKRMLEENPGSPLFLRNYAQFLYKCKKDRQGADEYYSRAILADPKDGEVLSQYAKLVWELHHDQDRASSYFERAVQASPEDSQVHAAYASFLWDTKEDEDGCKEQQCLPSHFHEGAMANAGT